MSLNWSVKDIANYETVCWEIADYNDPMRGIEKGEEIMSSLCNQLIWATIIIGIPSITEDNAAEFYARITMFEKLFGTFLNQKVDGEWVPRPITPEDVQRHIGLKTNATRKTRAQFVKYQGERLVNFEHDYRKAVAKQEAAEAVAV